MQLDYSYVNTGRSSQFNQIFAQHWESGVEHIFFDFDSDSGKIPFLTLTPHKSLRLPRLRLCSTETMQTKFARFCQKKLWLLSWTPKDLEKSTRLVNEQKKLGENNFCRKLYTILNIVILTKTHQNEIKPKNKSKITVEKTKKYEKEVRRN